MLYVELYFSSIVGGVILTIIFLTLQASIENEEIDWGDLQIIGKALLFPVINTVICFIMLWASLSIFLILPCDED